jgi:hypothetical protein
VKIAKKIFFLFFILFFAGTGMGLAHPFYVSICQMGYNRQNHSLEISVKIFADDLQTALNNRNIENLFLGEPKENPESNHYISEYLIHRITLFR